MTFVDFKRSPWSTSHPTYRESALAMSPAPEYASSEVLVAALYRTIGFVGISEGSVPEAGRDLEQRLQKLRDKRKSPPEAATVNAESWNAVLHGVLESPKLPNQSAKRFLQVTPLVPSLAPYSGSARLSNNSWPAGSLIRRMVWLGSKDHASAEALWNSLFTALSVDRHDDVFARWLEQETAAWGGTAKWGKAAVSSTDVATLPSDDFDAMKFMPARQFTKDLRALILAKNTMTRRQWTSLLESILRLAAVSHVTWLCDVQTRTWRCLTETLLGKDQVQKSDIREEIFPNDVQYMTYGGKALHVLKDKTSSYLSARLSINTLLWTLSDLGLSYQGDISSSSGINLLRQHIRINKQALMDAGIESALADIRDQEARALNCKKGIGANILEFSRHALGQRQTAAPLLRGYDQGYILKKKTNSSSSPWVVSLGPVAVLALVHCALAGMGGPRSIHRLAQHLSAYGVIVDRQDIAQNDLGHQLRMLGLVLDSPDAESGMLLLPPFPAIPAMDKQV